MNILHLKYMLEVERLGSITKAASKLYMGQPNLSKAIKEIEQEIGVEIFKRTVKGVVPTEKGREFLKHAQNILAEMDKIEALYKNDSVDRVDFRILIPGGGYISHAFTLFLTRLEKKKTVDINLIESDSLQTIDLVADSEYELGIIRYSKQFDKFYSSILDEKKLVSTEVWSYDRVVLVSKRCPLALQQSVTSDMLSDLMEITDETDRKNSDGKLVIVNNQATAISILSLTDDAYMWSCPLPEQELERYGLVQLNCSDLKKTYCDLLICRKEHKLNQTQLLFLDELNKVRHSIEKTL
ncbi:MAG: LysR family transcriptional regulator [Ruminococcus sp.]|nr:LysR family transcriptional regulator [Ruminococcus sp.]